MPLTISPVLATDDVPDLGGRDPELAPQCAVRGPGLVECADLDHVLPGDLAGSDSLTTQVAVPTSLLGSLVQHVEGMITDKQVVGSETWRVIATVQDVSAGWERTEDGLVDRSMNSHSLTVNPRNAIVVVR